MRRFGVIILGWGLYVLQSMRSCWSYQSVTSRNGVGWLGCPWEIGWEALPYGRGLEVELLLFQTKRSQMRWFGHPVRMSPGYLPGKVLRSIETPRTRYVFRLAWERFRILWGSWTLTNKHIYSTATFLKFHAWVMIWIYFVMFGTTICLRQRADERWHQASCGNSVIDITHFKDHIMQRHKIMVFYESVLMFKLS